MLTDPATPNMSAARELALILKELRIITDNIKSSKEEALVVADWKFAAIVLDRVCLLAFTAFTLVATLALFTTAPHILVT